VPDHWTDPHERCARRLSHPAVVPEACWAWPSVMLRAWSSAHKQPLSSVHGRESSLAVLVADPADLSPQVCVEQILDSGHWRRSLPPQNASVWTRVEPRGQHETGVVALTA
jgi:hypothetical protein